MIVTKFLYTILSDGTIDLKTTFQPQGILPELLPFGNSILPFIRL